MLTVLQESFVTFVLSVRHEPSTRRATQLSFAHGTFLLCALCFVVGETCAASKMPVTFGAGVPNIGERARRTDHAVATRLVTDVRDVTSTCYETTFKHVPFRRWSM